MSNKIGKAHDGGSLKEDRPDKIKGHLNKDHPLNLVANNFHSKETAGKKYLWAEVPHIFHLIFRRL